MEAGVKLPHGVSAVLVPSWVTLGKIFNFSGLNFSTGKGLGLLPKVFAEITGSDTFKGVSEQLALRTWEL